MVVRNSLLERVFRQISTLLENESPIFRQRKMLSLPRFGDFPTRKTAAGTLAAPAGTLQGFLLRDRHSLLEFSVPTYCEILGFTKGWLSKRVVLTDVPPKRRPERGYIRIFSWNANLGHPQTCVYPDVCLGIAHVSGKGALSEQGVW